MHFVRALYQAMPLSTRAAVAGSTPDTSYHAFHQLGLAEDPIKHRAAVTEVTHDLLLAHFDDREWNLHSAV
jgi:hypothetical protein